ncbi:class I SAM-dependent methyltransferase [Mycolicibacterium phlei]
MHTEPEGDSQAALSEYLADDLLSTTSSGWRSFYNKLTRRLEDVGVADSSFFLNYGYLSTGSGDESVFGIRDGTFNANSVRLVLEVVGPVDLNGRTVVEIGCGRGGNSAVIAEKFSGAQVIGVDLSSEAIAFCAKAHAKYGIEFKVGDALNLPLPDACCDAVVNIESSHAYNNLPKFLGEVRRICRPGAWFLHTDFLSVEDWDYARSRLRSLGFVTESDRDITANVLASRDQASNSWKEVYGDGNARVANFLAVPGSAIYEQLRAGLLEYRILRSRLEVPDGAGA